MRWSVFGGWERLSFQGWWGERLDRAGHWVKVCMAL
jgi:hypothetical protein